ncbi:NUDIX hydrolase [Rossellomorea vietnamensis]|uniref:NUDIX hydrolase n=2 Tax=Bacillaceae TaxID=186817 RepID=A0A5D4M9D5_9BACI|nr:NUDIX hydrolase [Rossellomorea vietnamensis]TYR98118.1 NUDIX hydrolase [Rossellomorea vietnamensis]
MGLEENRLKRGNVWLAAAGLLIDKDGRWLVVKKKYGGLKGMWSLPAGFVDEGETLEEAAQREVREETGLDTSVNGIIGIRSGVIKDKISDNMVLFLLNQKDPAQMPVPCEDEISEVAWKTKDELLQCEETSVMIHEMIKYDFSLLKSGLDPINPGKQFGYTSYKLFF